MAGFGGSVSLSGEREYREALRAIKQNLTEVNSEMKLVDSAYDANDKSTEALSAKSGVLNKQLAAQQEQVRLLRSRLLEMGAASGENAAKTRELTARLEAEKQKLSEVGRESGETSSDYQKQKAVVDQLEKSVAASTKADAANQAAMQKLRVEINNASAAANKTEKSIDTLGTETQETGNQFKDAGQKALSFGDILKANVISDAIVGGVKALASAVAAVAKELANTVKEAAAYGDEIYTLAAKTSLSTDSLQEYKYMADLVDVSVETITGSLTKLTKNMASAQEGSGAAADAFAKLGVSVTDSEGNLRSTDEVFREAIAALGTISNDAERDATAMEIFGKSAMEMNPLIKAGSDRLAELAEEAHNVGYVLSGDQLDALSSTQDAMDRLAKRLEGTKNQLAARFAPAINNVANRVLPALTDAVGGLFDAFDEGGFDGLTDKLMETLDGMLDDVTTYAPGIITSLIQGIMGALPRLVSTASTLVTTLINVILSPEVLGGVIDAGLKTIVALIQGITQAVPQLLEMLPDIIDTVVYTLLDNLGPIIKAGLDLIMALAQGIVDALPELAQEIPEIITTVVETLIDNLPDIILAGIDIVIALVGGIIEALPEIVKAVPEIVKKVGETLKDKWPEIKERGKEILQKIVEGIGAVLSKIGTAVGEIWQTMKDAFAALGTKIRDVGKNIVEGLWQGIKDATGWLKDKVVGFANGIGDWFKGVFGIHSPSKYFAGIGGFMAEGLGDGFSDEMRAVSREMTDAVPTSFSVTGGATGTTGNPFTDMVAAFKQALAEMKVELDGEAAGAFVQKTVTDAIFA